MSFGSFISGSSASGGSEWSGDIIFVEYDEQNKYTQKRWEGKYVILKAILLDSKAEYIEKAKIWKYTLAWTGFGWFGNWHEYTVVESRNWYWTFEKQMDALYVQRSKKLSDVKDFLVGEQRTSRTIRSEGRECNSIDFGESICDVISWIVANGELDKDYHLTQSNCHYFASRVYEAITRTAGKRLDTVKHN